MQDTYAHNERHLVTSTDLARNLYNFLLGPLRIITAYPIDKQLMTLREQRATVERDNKFGILSMLVSCP